MRVMMNNDGDDEEDADDYDDDDDEDEDVLQLQQFSQISKKIWTLLCFGLVQSFSCFQPFEFNLWISKYLHGI